MSEFEILGGKNYVPFITNIQVKNFGQTVIFDCTGDPEKTKTYRVFCLGCEKLELTFNKDLINCIDDNNVIDVVDFSIIEKSNKNEVYLYGRVLELELICEDIKIEQDW
jgi:hypothetical protein